MHRALKTSRTNAGERLPTNAGERLVHLYMYRTRRSVCRSRSGGPADIVTHMVDADDTDEAFAE